MNISTHVVAVLGAGYGGLQAATKLAKLLDRRWQVLLVDRSPVHELITRLPEVVGGVLDPRRCRIPYSSIVPRGVRFLRAEVSAVDPATGHVFTSHGEIRAQFIVMALGSTSDFKRVPGSEQHTWDVKSVAGSVRLYRRLKELIETRSLVRVAIVGGGYTATEVAGQLAAWNRQLQGSRAKSRFSIALVNDESHLLHGSNPRLGSAAHAILSRAGVALSMGVAVDRVEPGRVVVAGANNVEAEIIVWGAGSRASFSQPWPGLKTLQDGRLVVDQHLSAGGPGMYALGDSASVYDFVRDVPMASSAQLAMQQGDVVAGNVAAQIYGRRLREFRPRVLGEVLGLGGQDGAADVGGFIVTGRSALALKEAALLRYLRKIGGARLAAAYA
ncbi:MAG: NAD(P)/FAD-dependent oxidoreductase [Chloroflexota bacterium]